MEPPPELSVMTDKLLACCSPQLAGINQPLRPSMFGPGEVEPGAAQTTTTTPVQAPVSPSPAAVR